MGLVNQPVAGVMAAGSLTTLARTDAVSAPVGLVAPWGESFAAPDSRPTILILDHVDVNRQSAAGHAQVRAHPDTGSPASARSDGTYWSAIRSTWSFWTS